MALFPRARGSTTRDAARTTIAVPGRRRPRIRPAPSDTPKLIVFLIVGLGGAAASVVALVSAATAEPRLVHRPSVPTVADHLSRVGPSDLFRVESIDTSPPTP